MNLLCSQCNRITKMASFGSALCSDCIIENEKQKEKNNEKTSEISDEMKELRSKIWSKVLMLTVDIEYAEGKKKEILEAKYDAYKTVWEMTGGDMLK